MYAYDSGPFEANPFSFLKKQKTLGYILIYFGWNSDTKISQIHQTLSKKIHSFPIKVTSKAKKENDEFFKEKCNIIINNNNKVNFVCFGLC